MHLHQAAVDIGGCPLCCVRWQDKSSSLHHTEGANDVAAHEGSSVFFMFYCNLFVFKLSSQCEQIVSWLLSWKSSLQCFCVPSYSCVCVYDSGHVIISKCRNHMLCDRNPSTVELSFVKYESPDDRMARLWCLFASWHCFLVISSLGVCEHSHVVQLVLYVSHAAWPLHDQLTVRWHSMLACFHGWQKRIIYQFLCNLYSNATL